MYGVRTTSHMLSSAAKLGLYDVVAVLMGHWKEHLVCIDWDDTVSGTRVRAGMTSA